VSRIDWDAAAPDYRAARGLTREGLDAWRTALERWLPPAGGLPLLDLGCGGGQFLEAFAAWWQFPLVGVEPSRAMRAAALPALPRGAALVAGEPGHLPLRDASCGAAWLSTVIHHFPDLGAAAAELRRVVVPDGPVLIRSSFPGRHEGISLFRWFPGASRVASTFPTVEQTVSAFEQAGFEFEGLESVPQVTVPGLAAALERVRLRADTTLRLLDDAEFAEGLARLEAAAAAERSPVPVVDLLDLLVLR